MKSGDIQRGKTYRFMGTDSPARKHLEGQEFTVEEIKMVFRRRYGRSAKVKRFFNQDGIGARADELEPLDSVDVTGKDWLFDTASTISETPEPPTDDSPL